MKEEDFIKMLERARKYYENCISCGEITDVPRGLHIDFRQYYVEGAGQLCTTCGEKLNKSYKLLSGYYLSEEEKEWLKGGSVTDDN